MPSMDVNGANIYYELEGNGPPLVFISGAFGDARMLAGIADLLADEFTALTYDRRGNSRSPRPDGWETTSVDEQADDVAALIAALGLGPAAVYGNSLGAIIALNLLIRHPEAVRRAILHEPPLISVLEDPDGTTATLGAVVEGGMAAGGPEAAAEHFFRFVAGDGNWERLEPGLPERIRGNGDTFFAIEYESCIPYRPDDSELAAISAPVQLVVSEESAPFFAEAAGWLAARLGVEVVRTPGTHTPQLDRPRELAGTIHPFLRELSAIDA